VPKVEVALMPTNEILHRSFKGEIKPRETLPAVNDYIQSHKNPESFILRRSQILRFIDLQPKKRYSELVALLGIETVDKEQQILVDVEERLMQNLERVQTSIKQLFIRCSAGIEDFEPNTWLQVIDRAGVEVKNHSLMLQEDLTNLDEIHKGLNKKRQPKIREQTDSLTRAIDHIPSRDFSDISKHIEQLNNFTSEWESSKMQMGNYDELHVVETGMDFFEKNPDISSCPLCEQDLLEGYAVVFERLKDRLRQMKTLKEKRDNWRQLSNKFGIVLREYLRDINSSSGDLDLYTENEIKFREEIQSSLKALLENLKDRKEPLILSVPETINIWRQKFNIIKCRLSKEKADLIPPTYAQLERAFQIINSIKKYLGKVKELEKVISQLNNSVSRASRIRKAYTDAREKTLNWILSEIASDVVGYYDFLHKVNDDDNSDVTSMNLTPTRGSRSGSLNIDIDFYSTGAPTDPRTYLSEGHLDSLGLCIYLASVKKFNQPGSLLVLDDVISSNDKDHRMRIIELLLSEFTDYQVIITTHDEYWHSGFISKISANNIGKKWRSLKLICWSLDRGPETERLEPTWKFIFEHLNEREYRMIGGPLRMVFEDFLKRVANKLETRVRFQLNGRYNIGEFVCSDLNKNLKRGFRRVLKETDIVPYESCLLRIFGAGNLLNIIDHDNPDLTQVAFSEVSDFVEALKQLKEDCKIYGLITGYSN